VSDTFDLNDPDQIAPGLRHARVAIGRKQVVVIPADASYALAVNAFSPAAVALLREVKGWTTAVPPQVLIPDVSTLAGLAESVAEPVAALAEAFWPGPLTLVVPAGEMLQWDLGDNRGTVALRVPEDALTRELLADTGPLAVTQASRVGGAGASDPETVREVFSDEVAVYVVRGVVEGPASTIVDATGLGKPEGRLRILREGPISWEQLVAVVGEETFSGPPEAAKLSENPENPAD
jgi:L-threonylcarbamoyladenylate synthase